MSAGLGTSSCQLKKLHNRRRCRPSWYCNERTSHCNGIDHLIFERDRIAESWRTRRWDSLVANGPAWHDRFPSLDFEGHSGEDFVSKDTVVSYFENYVAHINAPVKCGVDVTHVTRDVTYGGFAVSTTCGLYRAKHIVAATGVPRHAANHP